jgi:aldehyde:ferredoxin oxidoreductase
LTNHEKQEGGSNDGYKRKLWGKIAWVDLTNEKVTIEEFDDNFARKYLGG